MQSSESIMTAMDSDSSEHCYASPVPDPAVQIPVPVLSIVNAPPIATATRTTSFVPLNSTSLSSGFEQRLLHPVVPHKPCQLPAVASSPLPSPFTSTSRNSTVIISPLSSTSPTSSPAMRTVTGSSGNQFKHQKYPATTPPSSVVAVRPVCKPSLPYCTKMPLPMASSMLSSHSKSKPPPLVKTNPTPAEHLEIAALLDHNYCIPYIPAKLPPPPPLPRKAIKVVKEVEVSRFKSIKYLFNRGEEQLIPQPTPRASSSKLEHLLKRTSNYEGHGISTYPTNPRSKTYNYYREEDNAEVDVVSVDPDPEIHCDIGKAKYGMNECETHVNFARSTDMANDWEDQIVKTGWTKVQHHLFKSVMKSLHAEYFTRLVYKGNFAEVILRRNSLDLTSQHVRKALAKVCWDSKLSKWLHAVLVDNLSHRYLAIYLDVLQTLRTKSPALVDRMIVRPTVVAKPISDSSIVDANSTSNTPKPQEREKLPQTVNTEAIHLLIKRQWDPFLSITNHKGIKLTCNPIFIFVPAGPSWGHAVNTRRFKNFVNMLFVLGKVITVTMAAEISTCAYLSIDELAEKMILSSKMKLAETKGQLPDRPIYLIGWGTGSIIAATVSLTEQVAGVICLGFPIYGAAGRRGEGSDPLLQMKHPVLFVIGDRATNCTISLMETFRQELSHLQNNAYIVAIKSGDEYLRVGRHHRKRLLVTQSYVDKRIIDEISLFVNDSFEAKSNVSMLPPLIVTNSLDHSYSNESALQSSDSQKRLNVNGEPIEGLGLSLAISNGHDSEAVDNPKKNRRKSYHRKSLPGIDDMSIDDMGFSDVPRTQSTSPVHQHSSTKKQHVKLIKTEPGGSGEGEGIGDSSKQISSFASKIASGGLSPYRPFVSGLLGAYPYFTGVDPSNPYSAAYAHVANQAAAIQRAIAMEAAGGYKQYCSQLEQYNANLQYRYTDAIEKIKKPRKPREPKPKGEKIPRRPRQPKLEKLSKGDVQNVTKVMVSANEQDESVSKVNTMEIESSKPSLDPGELSTNTVGDSKAITPVDPIQSGDSTQTSTTPSGALVIAMTGVSQEGQITRIKLPPPNMSLPPPSTTLAMSVAFSPTSYVSTTNRSTPPTSSTLLAEVYAVKSLPPALSEGDQDSSEEYSAKLNPSPLDSAPRSPPLLIPSQNSQNVRIPIRLCLQKDGSGDGAMSEMSSIKASLVPYNVEGIATDETSDLPALVPVRSQQKVISPVLEKSEENKPEKSPLRQRLRSGDQSKLSATTDIVVENAKNLQVKLPRLSLSPKINSSATKPVEVDVPRIAPTPHVEPIMVTIPEALPKTSTIKSMSPNSIFLSKPVVDLRLKSSSSSSRKPITALTNSASEVHHRTIVSESKGTLKKKQIPPGFETLNTSTEERDEISISKPTFRTFRKHKSSDEESTPQPPRRFYSKRPQETVHVVKKCRKPFRIVSSEEEEVMTLMPKKKMNLKRSNRSVKLNQWKDDDTTSDGEDAVVAPRKILSKRTFAINSSDEEKVKRKRIKPISKDDDSSDNEPLAFKLAKQSSKIYSSDEEIVQPKKLRSSKPYSGDETGKRRRQNSKTQLLSKELIPELSSAGEVTRKTRRPPTPMKVIEKRKSRGSGDTKKRNEVEARPCTPPLKSKTTTTTTLERRITRRSEEKKRPEPELTSFDVEQSTEDEDGERCRVTRSRALRHPSTCRGKPYQKLEESDGDEANELWEELNNEDQEADDGEDVNEKRRLRPIFPVTPASLSATRTRKVNIPKFYAYGM